LLNSLVFIVLPYVALALLLFVTPYRYFSNRLTWSAYSAVSGAEASLGAIPGTTASSVVAAHFWGSSPAP
jgi:nitrate reductase gamma subunit